MTDRQRWAFVGACALAGALAVPPGAVVTPISAGIVAVLGLLGLRVWRWSGLQQPMRSRGQRGGWRLVTPVAWLGLGLLLGLVVLGVMRSVIQPVLPSIGARIARAGTMPVWQRLAIVYVAAVGEELVFRLLLLSLFAGLMTRFLGLPAASPNPGVVWLANVLSALAFAAVHLPAWAGAAPMSPALLASVLTLNGTAGIVMGYVFATRGILAAIWTHAGADCAVQLLGPFTS